MSQKGTVIVIVILTKLYDCFIARLSQFSRFRPVPPCAADVYDARAYRLRLFCRAGKKRLALFLTRINRRAEYRADAHAVKKGYGEALISARKKPARQNCIDLSPLPLLVALTDSHPTPAQRIEAIRLQEGV